MFSAAAIISNGHDAKRAYVPTLSYLVVSATFYNRVSNTHNSVITIIITSNYLAANRRGERAKADAASKIDLPL